jgi:protein-disulfide isomerase
MRRFLAALLLATLALTAAPAQTQAQPRPSPTSFTLQQRADIVTILREALQTDPTILRDAIAALQADEGRRQEASLRSVIAAQAEALNRAPGDPVAGNPNGDETLVEFFDMRCPYCKRMLPVMDELLKRDPNLRVIYKDIPILGPGSVLGSKAALAAIKQNGYLKFREILMNGTPNIDQDALRAAAGKAGLDWERLQRDMADPAIQARIDANLALAHALEIQGTPAYVIGGKLMPGAVELVELRDAIAAVRRK